MTTTPQNVVYGRVPNGGLLFVPEPMAKELAQVQAALSSANTWGELRELLPAARLAEVYDLVEFDTPPAPDDPFDAGEIPAYGDGDWPEWPASYQLEWLPDDALALGSRDVSVLNGDFVEFAPEREQEIVEVLSAHGHAVRRDDELVAAASGM